MDRRKTTESKPAETQQEEPYHLKYRPQRLSDLLGQSDVTNSLKAMVKSRDPVHTYILVGPSGCGKTTAARILAAEFGCSPANTQEVDAASNSGIDAMRAVTATFGYLGFGDSPNRALIIDECHRLSANAWDSLLKSLEDTPAHVYIFLCTSEAGKLPKAINTRGPTYTFKSVKFDLLMDLLEMVDRKEDLRLPVKVLETVARSCDGSPRLALVMLAQVRDCEDAEEAGRLLETPFENAEVIELCRLLVSGKLDWPKLVDLLKRIPDMNPESVRIVIVNYLAACLMGAKSDDSAERLLNMLYPFSKPFLTSDKNAPLFLAFGDIILRR